MEVKPTEVKTSGLNYYRLEEVPAAHGFFTRHGGVSKGEFSDFNTAYKTTDPGAQANREKLFNAIKVNPDRVMILSPNHGDNIVFIDDDLEQDDDRVRFETDAAFTSVRDIYFLVSAADCILLLLSNKEFTFAGAVHLGWRNIVNGFASKAITAVSKKYNIKPSEIIAGISPSIRSCCYIYENPTQKEDPFWQPYLKDLGNDKYSIDLTGATMAQLYSGGLIDDNIFDASICTSCRNDIFFSCYKQGYVSGRFPVVIGLAKEFG